MPNLVASDREPLVASGDQPGIAGRLERLSRDIGGRWTGVRFDYDEVPSGRLACTKMRLCAAIAESFSKALVLPASLVSCPGALRSLGISTRDDDLVSQICENAHLPVGVVASAVKATPHLVDPVISVSLGRDIPFDVAVAYAQPAVIMNVVRRWQAICGTSLETGVSTFMAICGHAVVAAHDTGRIHLSLGCPTSRGEGVLDGDAMVVAIPRRILEVLFPGKER